MSYPGIDPCMAAATTIGHHHRPPPSATTIGHHCHRLRTTTDHHHYNHCHLPPTTTTTDHHRPPPPTTTSAMVRLANGVALVPARDVGVEIGRALQRHKLSCAAVNLFCPAVSKAGPEPMRGWPHGLACDADAVVREMMQVGVAGVAGHRRASQGSYYL